MTKNDSRRKKKSRPKNNVIIDLLYRVCYVDKNAREAKEAEFAHILFNVNCSNIFQNK